MSRTMFVLFTVLSIVQCQADIEVYLNLEGIITRWGYPVERYDVVTSDGYILDLYRIPHGRYDNETGVLRPAILMIPGLASAAFVFADGGFDVYLGNNRGSTYAKRHLSMSTSHPDFWKFSLDHLAGLDLPAIVDKVLEVSQQKSLFYVGHSQGARVGFTMLAGLPDYNRKIKQFFGWGAVHTGKSLKGAAGNIPHTYKQYRSALDVYRWVLGSHEIGGSMPFLFNTLASYLCQRTSNDTQCKEDINVVFGPSRSIFNTSRLGVYVAHFPAGASTMTAIHWMQTFVQGRVGKFDYDNPFENWQHYGMMHAPTYNYSQITAPTHLFWSNNDWFADGEEMTKLCSEFRPGVLEGFHEVPSYNHPDFALAIDGPEMIYRPMIRLMRDYEKRHRG